MIMCRLHQRLVWDWANRRRDGFQLSLTPVMMMMMMMMIDMLLMRRLTWGRGWVCASPGLAYWRRACGSVDRLARSGCRDCDVSACDATSWTTWRNVDHTRNTCTGRSAGCPAPLPLPWVPGHSALARRVYAASNGRRSRRTPRTCSRRWRRTGSWTELLPTTAGMTVSAAGSSSPMSQAPAGVIRTPAGRRSPAPTSRPDGRWVADARSRAAARSC